MKTIIIILAISAILFFIFQAFVLRATNGTETHAYKVLNDYGSFEVRQYEPALFSYVVMKSDSYKSTSSQGFRQLAGYIFGGNDKSQKIAMTSPVAMTMEDSVTMKFKIPEGMTLDQMPKPSNSAVRFRSEPEKVVAAIRFGGWSTDERIAEYTQKLKELLAEKGIEHNGNFSYLGYNPPYELINRKNEIIVELSTLQRPLGN